MKRVSVRYGVGEQCANMSNNERSTGMCEQRDRDNKPAPHFDCLQANRIIIGIRLQPNIHMPGESMNMVGVQAP